MTTQETTQETTFQCPQCNSESMNERLICDNDCRTKFCNSCSSESFKLNNGQWRLGHDPACGSDSDVDETNNISAPQYKLVKMFESDQGVVWTAIDLNNPSGLIIEEFNEDEDN